MSEALHGDWVVAVASLIASILGAVLFFLFDRLRASKRKIHFFVSEPQTITGELEGHGREFKVMLGDQVTNELNVSLLLVTNEGNEPIENLNFDITIPGERKIMLAECMSDSEPLKKAVEISFSDRIPQIDPIFNIRLRFFNAKESFHIKTLVDGAPAAPVVSCRLPSTTIELTEEKDIYDPYYRRRDIWPTIRGWIVKATIIGFAAYLIFYQLTKYQILLKKVPTDVIEQELKDRKSQLPSASETTK